MTELFETNSYSQYKYLAFSGGGFYGGAFIGAKVALDYVRPKQDWLGFSGASAGALMAFYMCLGLTSQEMYTLFQSQSKDWIDNHNHAAATPASRVAVLKKLIVAPLYQKYKVTSMSFEDLFKATNTHLCVVAHNLNTVSATYMSAKTHPKHDVVCAIQASMSVPFVFSPVTIDGDLMVDGGLSDNLPSNVFGAPGETLSLWIKSNLKKKSTKELESSPIAFAQQVILSLFYSAENSLQPDKQQPRPDTVVMSIARSASFFPSAQDLAKLKMYLFQGCSAVLLKGRASHEDCWKCFSKIYEMKEDRL